MKILTTDNLTKKYYGVPALDGVTLSVEEGEIYGLVGRNGAGKTTLIRVVAGLARKSSGAYSVFGISDGDKNLNAARKDMRVMVESATFYPGLSAERNMRMQCTLMGEDPACIPQILHEVELDDVGKKPAKNFSLGMRQRLAIAMAMIGSPRLMLLDEPTNGLDPEGIYRIRELLIKLNRERGVTMLVSSHILPELSKFATRYGFIEGGRLIKELTHEQLEEECGGDLESYYMRLIGGGI